MNLFRTQSAAPNRRRIALGVAALCATTASVVAALPRPASAQEIIRSSMMLTVTRFTRFSPPGRKEPVYGQWSFVPRGEFNLRGPVGGGAQLVFVISKPTGAPWLSLNLDTPEIAEGSWDRIQLPSLEESKAAIAPGAYPFKIVLKNALTGSDKVLFTGKLDVKTKKGGPGPKETDFYVDHDWTLPMGYLEVNTQIDENVPSMNAHFFFRGPQETSKLAAYVFYNGKQIASTKNGQEGSVGSGKWYAYPPAGTEDPCWERITFYLTKVRVFDHNTNSNLHYDNIHVLEKNPGEYEIKILREGKLVRSAKFTIGADGKLVDNGFARQLNTSFIFMPVKVIPGNDGSAVLTDYATKAYYYNPLKGYTAP